MRPSLVQLEAELSRLLLRFGLLVSAFEQKQPQALQQLQQWLQQAESLLGGQQHVAAAELAALRSKLLQPVYQNEHRGAVRREQLRQAVDLLQPAQQTLAKALAPVNDTLTRSRELLRQLLGIVQQSQAVSYQSNQSFDSFVQQIWLFISGHDQLRPGAVQLRSWLSQQDIWLLIAAEVEPAEFQF